MRKRIWNAKVAIVMLILEGISMSCQRANQPDRDGLSSLSESAISNVSPFSKARRLGLTCQLQKRMISMHA
ncbi:hypothetical protein BDZ91DRAFT_729344 [Kalaharituber pfeilii]|nr:hypothetical protein BDZ91DRAFT_729344 [Kalaharituber pfeilii]